MPSLYQTTPETGTVSSANSTSLYSNTTDFTSGVVNSSVYSVNGGTGVTVNPTTGNVVVSIGQPVAVTDNPTFAGATLGNITVGLTSNQVINTITGDLNIQAQSGTQSVIVSGQFVSNNDIDTILDTSAFTKLSASTNSIVPTLYLNASSTGTVAPGFGTELLFFSELSTNVSRQVGSIQLESTNVTTGSESFDMNFVVKRAGVLTERMSLDSLGNLQIDNDLTVSGGTVTLAGSTSGTVALNAPAIAGTQSYTLPTAVPASNGYVLSSTTAGVMSWAATAPGAGDVTGPASATDNALTRFDGTTGKLIQNSNAILDDTGNLSIAGDLTVTGGDITTGAALLPITITRNTASTNAIREALILRVDSSGTPAVGIGTSLTFQTETAVGVNTTAGAIILESTSVTPGSETFNMNFNVGTFERMVLDNAGNLQIDGDLTVSGNDIKSSSATALTLSGANVTVAGDLTVTGNDIKSSSATALTLSGANVTVAGDLTVTGNDIKSSSATALTLSGANVTVAGELDVTGYKVRTGVTNTFIGIERTTTATNIGSRALSLKTISTGTPTVGFGTNLEFQGQTAASTFKSAGLISVTSTDVTVGSEDFNMDFQLMRAGATATTVLSVVGTSGDLVMTPGGKLTIQGLTSGSTSIGAPATGSTLTYVLPGTAGAANSVLTNDGAGTLSWTTNTNGDVVGPASATDNAVARFDTTTGKLIQNSTVTIDDSGNIVTNGTLDVQGGTITESTGALSITTGAANGAITLAPNGTGNVALTLANGGNLTNDRNYVFGAVRNSTTLAAGDIWTLNASSSTLPVRGVSMDNVTDFATKNAGTVIRNYSNTGAFGPRLVFERARYSSTPATPATLSSGDTIGIIQGTGYSSTLGWVNDTLSLVPAFASFTTSEAWASNTNLGTQFNLQLAPSATTMTSAANLVPVITANPQTFACRSDAYTWSNGKTGTTQRMSLDVSGNLVLSSGNITATAGNIVATAGNITATAGNISTTTGSISASGAFDSNEALSSTANLLNTNNQAGSSIGIKTSYWTSSAKTTLSVPQNTYKLGNFRFNSYSDTAGTFALGAQVISEATENWTSSANGSRIIFLANKQGQSWTTGHTGVISAAPESANISSDIITLENSSGTDYAVLNSTSATFSQPVQFPNKTAAQWNAITGAVGMQVCVNDSPVNAGKMAYWDTTNARWSYVDTNLAI